MTIPRSKSRPGRQTDGRAGGFTIIEVMIVLAIAGIMLLIVFQAIPTLQRNGRNNQRKQDVAAILQAASQYELNNSGDFPTNHDFLQYTQDKLSYYQNASNINIHLPPDPNAPIDTFSARKSQPAIANVETVEIYNYQKCDSDTIGAGTITGAGYSDVVALYALERSSGTAVGQCQQL